MRAKIAKLSPLTIIVSLVFVYTAIPAGVLILWGHEHCSFRFIDDYPTIFDFMVLNPIAITAIWAFSNSIPTETEFQELVIQEKVYNAVFASTRWALQSPWLHIISILITVVMSVFHFSETAAINTYFRPSGSWSAIGITVVFLTTVMVYAATYAVIKGIVYLALLWQCCSKNALQPDLFNRDGCGGFGWVSKPISIYSVFLLMEGVTIALWIIFDIDKSGWSFRVRSSILLYLLCLPLLYFAPLFLLRHYMIGFRRERSNLLASAIEESNDNHLKVISNRLFWEYEYLKVYPTWPLSYFRTINWTVIYYVFPIVAIYVSLKSS